MRNISNSCFLPFPDVNMHAYCKISTCKQKLARKYLFIIMPFQQFPFTISARWWKLRADGQLKYLLRLEMKKFSFCIYMNLYIQNTKWRNDCHSCRNEMYRKITQKCLVEKSWWAFEIFQTLTRHSISTWMVQFSNFLFCSK